MKGADFTTAFSVNESPERTFAAITNPREWWSQEIEGRADVLGAEFRHRYKDVHHCQLKVIERVPNEKIVWRVVDNYFNFINDQTEWRGTDIIFELAAKGDGTEVRFTHRGLVPQYECFDLCSNAWSTYINGSLRSLIATGQGQPNQKE